LRGLKEGFWFFLLPENLSGFASSREKKQPGPDRGKRLTQSREDAKGGREKRVGGIERGVLVFSSLRKPSRLRAFA
jgi:hypothetical protein